MASKEELENAIFKFREDIQAHAEICLTILDKDGKKRPLVYNRAQEYIHRRIEEQLKLTGKVRAIILKGRQQGGCYSPEMRVLTSDYQWVRLADIEVGTSLWAVDENTGSINAAGRKTERRIRTSVVEAKVFLQKEAFEVELSNGAKLIVSGEHRHLCRKRGGDDAQWREVQDTKVGDHIRAFTARPRDSGSFEDGWFGGLLDGEGSFGANPCIRIGVSQVDGAVLSRAKRYLTERGIRYYELIDSRQSGDSSKLGNRPVHCLRIDRQTDVMRLLCETRPSRFVSRALFDGKKMPKSCDGFDAWAKVVSIRPVGKIDVIDLQTSAKTYVCEGIVSHNSTYIGGRFYSKTTLNPGRKAFIVAHEDKATTNLFNMVKRYHNNNPLSPSTSASNAKELVFDQLDGGYILATAGSKDVGRSNTAQLAHLSEFAFWQGAEMHLAGLGNTIPDAAGTEIIIESTANGIGNKFHQMWQDAEAGIGEYIAIFVPWFWQDEYRAMVPRGFELTTDELKYQEAYGLDLGQMSWRRNKITTYGQGFEWLFDQEYPATPSIAFKSSTDDPLINPTTVMAAVNSVFRERTGALVIGCDPAEMGKDRTAIVFRQGRTCFHVEYKEKKTTMEIAGILVAYYHKHKPDAIFVDKVGLGSGIVDRLKELNVPVIGVNSAERAEDHETYHNKRAEIWYRMKEWLEDTPNRIPNSASLLADLSAPGYKTSSNGRRLIESKESMAKRQVRSPDGADALAMTFAEHVEKRAGNDYGSGSDYVAPSNAGY